VIVSFADRETQALSEGKRVARFESIERIAQRKLLQLRIAQSLADLAIPPGNNLEALRGNRAGQMSIRINNKWRICFIWTPAGPAEVEIVNYH
jgi:proteic killer suppression protein